jgi:adenylate cyclase class IV
MTREYELRFEVNYDSLIKKLNKFGTKNNGFVLQTSRIYYKEDASKLLVRIRSEGVKHLLTIKIIGDKYPIEEEIEVSDPKKTEKILINLGCKFKRTNQKLRESYSKGSIKFDIDFYPGAIPILEIEAKSEKKLIETYTKLGLTPKKITMLSLYKDRYGYEIPLDKNYDYQFFKKIKVDKNKEEFKKNLKFQFKIIDKIKKSKNGCYIHLI